MSRKIKAEFTEAQASAIRIALRSTLEDEWLPPGRVQAAVNALREIDSACWRAERKVRAA